MAAFQNGNHFMIKVIDSFSFCLCTKESDRFAIDYFNQKVNGSVSPNDLIENE